ncbi:MAG: pilus assembly PilX family protein [Methylococcales bacterium]
MKTLDRRPQEQTGAILVVSLVLLTIMTLIGITAMQTTILQEKMAGNSRDMNLAFEAAEAANREGENWLLGLTTMPDPRACNSGICLLWNAEGSATALYSATGAAFYTDPLLWGNARSSSMTTLEGVHTPPFFVIEFDEHQRDSQNLGQQQDLQNSRSVYRITSKGTGGTDAAQSFVQTHFARRF